MVWRSRRVPRPDIAAIAACTSGWTVPLAMMPSPSAMRATTWRKLRLPIPLASRSTGDSGASIELLRRPLRRRRRAMALLLLAFGLLRVRHGASIRAPPECAQVPEGQPSGRSAQPVTRRASPSGVSARRRAAFRACGTGQHFLNGPDWKRRSHMGQTINEVMTHDPRTVSTDAPLTDVAKEMDQADTGAIIVAEEGRFKGIVTDRDIVVRAIAAGKDPEVHHGRRDRHHRRADADARRVRRRRHQADARPRRPPHPGRRGRPPGRHRLARRPGDRGQRRAGARRHLGRVAEQLGDARARRAGGIPRGRPNNAPMGSLNVHRSTP